MAHGAVDGTIGGAVRFIGMGWDGMGWIAFIVILILFRFVLFVEYPKLPYIDGMIV